MSVSVNVLVATYNEGIFRVCNLLLPPREDISYIISHQITSDVYDLIPNELHRDDVSVFKMCTKGLSKNRNFLIQKSNADICIIADDDVTYTFEYIDKIKNAFIISEEVDVLIGKIFTGDNQPIYKNYPLHKGLISWLNFTKISSVEISFRRTFIQNRIYFDERFGLGAHEYPYGGEESIFISDCLKKGGKIVYIPEYVVNHPYESSRNKVINNINLILYHKALYYRIFGRFVYLIYPLLFFKNRKKYSISFFKFLSIGFNS